MKNTILVKIAALLVLASASVFVASSVPISAKDQQDQSVDPRFENYRKAIRDAFQVDIKNFKEKLTGGMADGKPVTDYDLEQLLEGIKWEREHADDNLVALELAMDHLERIPDYYTRLLKLERGAMSDRLLQM